VIEAKDITVGYVNNSSKDWYT